MTYSTLPEAHEALLHLQGETSGNSDVFRALVECQNRMKDVYGFIAETLHPMVNTTATGALLGAANTANNRLQTAAELVLNANSAIAELTEAVGQFRLE